MPTTDWFMHDSGQSQVSSNSFVSTQGTGTSATATSTSEVNGSKTTSSQQIYTSGATLSSSSAIAISSPGGATVNTNVSAPSSI